MYPLCPRCFPTRRSVKRTEGVVHRFQEARAEVAVGAFGGTRTSPRPPARSPEGGGGSLAACSRSLDYRVRGCGASPRPRYRWGDAGSEAPFGLLRIAAPGRGPSFRSVIDSLSRRVESLEPLVAASSALAPCVAPPSRAGRSVYSRGTWMRPVMPAAGTGDRSGGLGSDPVPKPSVRRQVGRLTLRCAATCGLVYRALPVPYGASRCVVTPPSVLRSRLEVLVATRLDGLSVSVPRVAALGLALFRLVAKCSWSDSNGLPYLPRLSRGTCSFRTVGQPSP